MLLRGGSDGAVSGSGGAYAGGDGAGSSVGAIVRGAAWRSRWARIAAFISSR
jgi:hypothetical protein